MMSWEELVAWQDHAVGVARQSMLTKGSTAGAVMMRVNGPAPQFAGGAVEVPAREPGGDPEESVVCLPRLDTPEGVLAVMQLAGPDPRFEDIFKIGRVMGWSRRRTAEKLLKAAESKLGLDQMDLYWGAIRKLAERIDAYALLNVTEMYNYVGPEALAPGARVRDMPGRKEGVMVSLDSRLGSRAVHFTIERERPWDETSKVVSATEPWVLPGDGEGRMIGLIRRAS